MNRLDDFLCTLPQSTNGWHCPWFRVILLLGLNGVIFGLWAFIKLDAWLGLIAFVIGLCASAYTLYHRFQKGSDKTC